MRRPSTAVPPAALLTLLAGLALAAPAGGCSRFGGSRAQGAPPERLVPADALAAVLIPRLGEASRQAAALQGALAARPGAGDLTTLRAALGAQLGLDLFDPASLSGAGLDPERGLAVALLPPATGASEPRPLLVLPASDAGKVRALADRLARDRLGATDARREGSGDGALEVWRTSAGSPPVLTAAFPKGLVLLAPGPVGPETLGAVLRLGPDRSLEQAAAWKQARAALGESPALLAWLPSGTRGMPPGPFAPLPPSPGGLAAGLSASPRGLRLIGAALLGSEEARLRPLAAPGPGRGEPPAASTSSILVIRLTAELRAALALLDDPRTPVPPALAALAATLAPPLDLGVALPAEASFGRALAGRGGDALRALRLEAVSRIVPGRREDALAALAALVGPAAARGADGAWRAPLAGGDVLAWAVNGEALHLLGGPDAAVERPFPAAPAGFTAPSPTAAAALAGGLGGAVLHVDNLVRAVRALPPSAFGAGPDAVVARSMAMKLAALPGRGAFAALRADLPAGAVRVALDLDLGEPPERTP